MKAFDKENNVWSRFSEKERVKMEEYCKNYRFFLDTARTERLAVKEILSQAESCCRR